MKRVTLLLSTLLVLASSPMVRAEAVPLSDVQIAAVREGCKSALRGIGIVQENEAASRVNRGRAYESTMRLITALNSRVALNKLDAPILTKTTADIQKTLDSFHVHYLDYASKMDQTAGIDCRKAPVSFYDSLSNARDARALVAKDITTINQQLDLYQQGLTNLRETTAKAATGVPAQ